jgi:hypothetical protein
MRMPNRVLEIKKLALQIAPVRQPVAARTLDMRSSIAPEAGEAGCGPQFPGERAFGSEAFTVNSKAPHAARVSLGAAHNRVELTHALQILVTTLRQSLDKADRLIVSQMATDCL